MSPPRVKVISGELEGISCVTTGGKKFSSFLGIPYGQPPVGQLRFKDPLPAQPWNGLRNATVEGNIAPQIGDTNEYVGDEDCLFLNVHTPQLSPSGETVYPVMVYLHGGAFFKGSGNRAEFGPEYIIEKDCILVTMNYRLGVLGFLCLEASFAPGNMGLKDQNLAMKWVVDNIGSFGGDPGNITLFGNSAGAVSAECHVLSPLSHGLFHKLIIQSGSVINPYFITRQPLDNPNRLAERLGKKLKDPKEIYNFFSGVPAKQLIEEAAQLLTDDDVKLGKIISFTPVVTSISGHDDFLSASPFHLLKDGKFIKIPTISGHCDKEGILIKPGYKNQIRDYLVDHKMIECLPREFKVNIEEFDDKMKRIYRQRSEDRNVDDYIIDFLTDLTFLGGMCKSVELKLKYQKYNYFYRFSYDGNINFLKTVLKFQEKGACHADELTYLATHAAVDTERALPKDVLVRNRMVQMWTDFAKTGDPTPNLSKDISIKWLPVTQEQFGFLDIGEELILRDNIYDERINLWKELYKHFE